MAIMTRLLSCTLLALFALNGQVLADQQQQQPPSPSPSSQPWKPSSSSMQPMPSNSNYGNDKKPDGPMNGSGWQPSNDSKPGDGKNMSAADWPGPPTDGGDKPDSQPGQGPPHAPPSNPPPGHPDQWHHGDGKYGKTQVVDIITPERLNARMELTAVISQIGIRNVIPRIITTSSAPSLFLAPKIVDRFWWAG
ncbi:hypothetical protein CPC08DRAFT_817439 [Agrocybe pediades]|nr:hypothetical protein CPC08DRAFT_817439 [Agrocybe pediades]